MFLLLTPGNRQLAGQQALLWLAPCICGCIWGVLTCEQHEPHLSLKDSSGDVPLGWDAGRFRSLFNFRELCYAILTFLKPGLVAVGALARSASVEECQRVGQCTHGTTQTLITRT